MGLVFWHCLLLQLLRWTGMDWDQKTAHICFLDAPIIIQIMIILHKTPNLEWSTGLKMDRPIRHLPKLTYGQSVSVWGQMTATMWGCVRSCGTNQTLSGLVNNGSRLGLFHTNTKNIFSPLGPPSLSLCNMEEWGLTSTWLPIRIWTECLDTISCPV